MRGGAATILGNPEFYQYNTIGGSQRLRGFRRDRFYGKSTVNSNNELQWLTDFRSAFMNGKAGLVAFYDIGRVWMPGEDSDLWNSGYGGGILLAPFNKISFTLTYGFSDEVSLFHIRFNKTLF
jgi:hemolysin activation/secretion protein